MDNTILMRRSFLPLLAAAGLALGACDDPTEIEDHPEVDGFAIIEGTTEIYRYMLDDDHVPTLTLTQGLHTVTFLPLDHDGAAIPEEEDPHADEEIVLEITIADTGVLTWAEETPEGPHTFVEFSGDLNAIEAGSTSMKVCVPHEGHCDFEADVPVTVTAQ